MTCVHEQGFSFLFLSQPKQVYFFVFSKLPRQTRWPDQQKWTERDAEELADKIKDHPVSDSLLFGTIWRSRIRGQLVSVEEGIFKQWHFGRMVLVGDSAHKVCHRLYHSPHFIRLSELDTNNTATQVTPNFALGGNTGMESVAVLTNELHRLLEETPQGRPTKHAITVTFQRYHSQRLSRVRKIGFLSGFITRLQAFDGTFMRCMAQWIVPFLIGYERIADQLGYLIRQSPKLDFIQFEPRKGTMAWSDENFRPSQSRHIWRALVLAGGFGLISTCIMWRSLVGCIGYFHRVDLILGR